MRPPFSVRLTAKRFTRKTHPRTRGQAARRLPRLTVQPAGDVCKRRDAVRLALHEPARPAGAAFGVLSGATMSWAAPRQRRLQFFLFATQSSAGWSTKQFALRNVGQNLGADAAT